MLMLGLSAAGIVLPAAGNAAGSVLRPQATIAFPGGAHGIGFDDMDYFPELEQVVVPSGQTGSLGFIDPVSGALTTIQGITAPRAAATGHGEGTTSVACGGGYLFASDRDDNQVVIVDPRTKKPLGRVQLDSAPDYVRYLSATHELWVTEPRAFKIEVFNIGFDPQPLLTRVGVISVPGGPESLIVDDARGLAYTNRWVLSTVAIDIHTRRIAAIWSNRCVGARGLALDASAGFVFVGCDEGKAVVLDARHDGRVLATARTGKGVDIVDYDQKLRHLYVPGADSATLTILQVDPAGHLQPVAVYKTANGAHCVVADQHAHAYVCDPHGGRVFEITDRSSAESIP